eukprot:1140565-Pelagomonas_calceolata.AAC.1
MIAERLEFQTFSSKQSQHCQPPNQGKPCPGPLKPPEMLPAQDTSDVMIIAEDCIACLYCA